ncbi:MULTISPECIES: methylamine utilization protein [unclassified Pseudomonas]|nr:MULTISPECIES: methylamine utilization protein [unclassified Pseudomonas]MEB0044971.1 methylamine utilization protein [Pseudomonas sp. Dout3]MEB0096017.1 methylamine utilization protein [Pseudomonas sp. DC1.2]WPX61653.1 methylamine utilization protein [Pseudomonas sp. DC1.2]
MIAATCASPLLSAAPVQIQVHDQNGLPLADAVVTLQGPIGQPAGTLKADMDQRDQQFAPHVLAVHTGTLIKFPNSDNIRHQVYSFSPAKRFELRLYEGTPSAPVLFDKPGVVVLGCNIHDWMLGYVYVTDDPRFGVTDAQGQLMLEAPTGVYHATLWHPQALDMQPVDGAQVTVPAKGLKHDFALTLQAKPGQATAAPPSAFGDAFKRAAHETAQ